MTRARVVQFDTRGWCGICRLSHRSNARGCPHCNAREQGVIEAKRARSAGRVKDPWLRAWLKRTADTVARKDQPWTPRRA